ncbi:phage tail sheath subtilisin-like domain-containing protein [Kitasatospora sp. CM 4170]|uniref:Phage tail sheath family protein n=1 Tax=Kitasatospora aburaviensis TaxID=67265 RepID=A0ABW1ETV0_9ACTN|nr:phage tail sheath C-terminal domain-containing protein [Kitasatospora sp. CM 4170]WNM44572.1 phage tail sheath subtilisin-like domain-containing protein [Kitasatospora sp. CM 4170]
MPELLHPGVYVLEAPSAVKPIEGVSTSTAGFVGVADKGPVPGFVMPFGEPPQPPLVTSFAEFTRLFGGFRTDSYLAYAVQAFFDNGGRRAYIVRVVTDGEPDEGYGPGTGNARLAGVGLLDREERTSPTLAVVARSPGAWANTVALAVTESTTDPQNLFRLTVYDAGLPVESFDGLGMDPAGERFVDTTVNGASQYVYVKSVVPDGVSFADARPAATATSNLLTFTAEDGTALFTASAHVSLGQPLSVRTVGSATDDPPTFSLQVLRDDRVVESHENLSMDPALGNFVERKVNAASRHLVVRAADPAVAGPGSRPADATAAFTQPAFPAGIAFPGGAVSAGAGSDGRVPAPGDSHFVGRADRGSGLHAFDGVTDVNIIAIPGSGNDLTVSAGMAYCRNRPLQDAFFVADVGVLTPADARVPGARPDVGDRTEARDFVRALSTPSDYGAAYYPWLRVSDPIGKGRNPTIAVPPSGAVAGLYARIDNSRGVFKAPAGTEAGLAGAIGLCDDLQDADQDVLNPVGLNALRRFPGYGIVAWGARTSATDAAWRYIPVRRTAIFLRASIHRGIQWAVFEPNDEPLWSQLRLNVRAFMLTQFRAGAFQGATPAEAFFVACDATTTTQQDIDNGVVNLHVGFAPLKPAEFVVFTLSQKVDQSAV